ncbi:MAG: valine--tRNA ligase [Deltaproteobacteria bacterium]|nr:valine--tRNA ligase [Deltaproteobacteria bacterium]
MKELPKVYEPHAVEDRWIQQWIDRNYFAPDLSNKSDKSYGTYSIVIPPPNVTGSLHMGHALNNTLQDILVRYRRMKGDNTLWVVGTDHAGIATQNVVEKQLSAEGKTRFDLGREKFVERVWQWRRESGGTIINQLKRLGASCDYVHERFTMDEGLSAAVRKVFVQLYNEGFIYRGLRLINWCPRCHTALSDLEVEHEEQKGHLWHVRYGDLIVATTRPETMLGDTAVAVHPDDERYKDWIGKKVLLPLVNREIPVIADEYVDRTFGSGVVKITPAHDFNDFEIGNRHQLERINILTEDGKINQAGGPYAGLSIQAARRKVVEDLEAQELLEKVAPHTHAVGHCYRCKAVVEPYLSLQWYVKTKPLAEPAIEAVKAGKTRFVPEHWASFHPKESLDSLGTPTLPSSALPAAYIQSTPQSASSGRLASETFSAVPLPCPPVVSESPPSKCPSCGSTELMQDPDVLDTWFSSALWPFSTLGWPDQTPKLKKFYPTSVLVTAFDIIFFWVARMMMMGIHFMKEVPFCDVHIHAIVRDPLGQKMSKSKGNVIDPLLLMKKYGTDAFRFTLAAFAAQGRDIKLDEARVEGYRNFCNKIWNASRFALMNAAPFIKSEKDFYDVEPKTPLNRWIISELSRAVRKVEEDIQKYEFNRAAHEVYSFFWYFFCDWYLEFSKTIYLEGTDEEKNETSRTIYFILDSSLRLLHPFMPFITEEIWQMLANRKGKSIVTSDFPVFREETVDDRKPRLEYEFLIELVSNIRSIRQETGVPISQPVDVIIHADRRAEIYANIEMKVKKLARIGKMVISDKEIHEPAAVARLKNGTLYIPLQGLIDLKKEEERLKKKLQKTVRDIDQLKARLEDPEFLEHVEPELVEEKRAALASTQAQKEILEKGLKLLKD